MQILRLLKLSMRAPQLCRILTIGSVLLFTLAGCASQEQMLDNSESMAVQTAVGRARFDMNCSSATGQVISREMVQPALRGPFVNGIPRAEFTIGVTGCDKRKSYIVICPQGGTGCFATGPGPFHGDFQ